jgi:hypothetical protein
VNRAPAALAAGSATLALVGVASLLAWREGPPLVPEGGGSSRGSATWFLSLLVAAFACYLLGLWLLRRAWRVRYARVAALAVAIQLVPLAAPLLLSTDAWTYWDYGWIAAVGGGNPYSDPPSAFPESPAYAYMGRAWHDTTSVYGPTFTLASEPIARAAGNSSDAAAWAYKTLAAIAAVAASLLAGRLARRRALAVAFVGWNPLLAVQLAGGGHNDAWVGALAVAALALAVAARQRRALAGVAWVLAITVKWVPVVFLGLILLARGRGGRGRVSVAALLLVVSFVALTATWRYGTAWVGAPLTLAGNAALETSYALPSRLEQLGLPKTASGVVALSIFVGGLALLARGAAHGRPRLGRAALLILVTTPYLAVWYLAWAVPLAGAEEDRWARIGCLLLGAYLLPQGIPL